MKIKGEEVEKPIEEQTTIYKCPYCRKKLINKNSYYNHIARRYCTSYDVEFARMSAKYEADQISAEEYYTYCLKEDYIYYMLDFNKVKELKGKISDELYKKIEERYIYE